MPEITMRQYVEWYHNKLQRNQSDWTLSEIVEDCGAPTNLVLVLREWCENNGKGLSDVDLLAKFEGGYFINRTPFGYLIGAKPAFSAGPLTLANFISDLNALIARYTS